MLFASELQDLFEPYQQFLDVGKTFKLRGASMGAYRARIPRPSGISGQPTSRIMTACVPWVAPIALHRLRRSQRHVQSVMF